MKRTYRESFVALLMLFALGCDSSAPEPPPLNEETRSAIEEQDRMIEEEESAR